MVMYNKGIAIVKSFRAYEKNRIIKVKLITYKHVDNAILSMDLTGHFTFKRNAIKTSVVQ